VEKTQNLEGCSLQPMDKMSIREIFGKHYDAVVGAKSQEKCTETECGESK
jgi:hypothetical protein